MTNILNKKERKKDNNRTTQKLCITDGLNQSVIEKDNVFCFNKSCDSCIKTTPKKIKVLYAGFQKALFKTGNIPEGWHTINLPNGTTWPYDPSRHEIVGSVRPGFIDVPKELLEPAEVAR
ncbi:MAG: hypothetical protein WCY36_07335 [Candidatus Omnitrophota bacterium]